MAIDLIYLWYASPISHNSCACHLLDHLLVVRFTVNNPVAPINLLQQHNSEELMREGHFGEAQLVIGSIQYFPGNT